MAKAAQDIRVCPTCGSRNKLKWDFCARCGESLQGIPVGEPKPAAGVAAEPEVEASAPMWPVAVIAMAAVVAAGALWQWGWRLSPGARPEAGVFAAPTLPPSPPPPGIERKGAAAYAEAVRLAGAGDFASAVPLFEKAIAEDPDSAAYRYGFGAALLKVQRTADAFQRFQEAAQMAPREYQPMLARQLAKAGRDEEAIRAFEAGLSAGADDVRKELGRLLYDQKQYDRAASVLAAASVANPGDSELRFNLGWAVENLGRLDEAERIYRALVEDDKTAVSARVRLAEVTLARGNSEGAVTTLREGLAITPSAPNLHRGLGSVLERMGRNAEAAASYREYARLNPKAEDATQLAERATVLEKRASAGS